MRNVVITGAYGGMGYAAAKELSGNGYTVFALDRTVKDAEPNIIPVETDVTDAEELIAFTEEEIRKAAGEAE